MDIVDSLFANFDHFPYVFKSVYPVYVMPKTAAQDIHRSYQYDPGKLWFGVRKPQSIQRICFYSFESIISRLVKS